MTLLIPFIGQITTMKTENAEILYISMVKESCEHTCINHTAFLLPLDIAS